MRQKLGEIEREKRPESFELELTDGTVAKFADPKKLHWTVLSDLDEMGPADQIKTLVGEEHYPAFRDDPEMDGEMLEKVMNLWRDHYGLGSSGNSDSSGGS